ncbi:MAG: antitoxin component YwqK of YwqJK toxin-antitoxin module [Planctomycetota bacterium]|jgi:antitoxin component YwqK of YwqJK toxin-antitoxin module|uniref:toxin-antitoxin system YwqK family antitoxin n=1 Tax=Patiriisocius sp. Uisw_047 TaxID=3230969 RepID=UPI0039EBC7C9
MRFLIPLFLLVVSFGNAQEINQMDTNGARHGLWKKYFEGTKQLRYEGTFDHGKEVGIFKFYCDDCKGQPAVTKEFTLANAIADVKYFTVKAKLVSEGKMDGKLRIGEWLTYHKKGAGVMTKETYQDGKLTNKKYVYYPNGVVAEEATYAKGLLDGTSNFYSYDAKLLKELIYKNDLLEGPAVYYDATGAKLMEGVYVNDRKKGIWKFYKDGVVDKEETFPKPLEKNKKN